MPQKSPRHLPTDRMARARCRINEGRLRMWYELVRIQDIRDHADKSISEEITGGLTGIPLYHGSK